MFCLCPLIVYFCPSYDAVGEFRGGGPEVFEGPESCSRSDFLAGFSMASGRVADFANSIVLWRHPNSPANSTARCVSQSKMAYTGWLWTMSRMSMSFSG